MQHRVSVMSEIEKTQGRDGTGIRTARVGNDYTVGADISGPGRRKRKLRIGLTGEVRSIESPLAAQRIAPEGHDVEPDRVARCRYDTGRGRVNNRGGIQVQNKECGYVCAAGLSVSPTAACKNEV